MKRFFFYVALLLTAGGNLFVACKTDGPKTAAQPKLSPAAVQAQLDALRDSVRVSWSQLNNLTDHKLKTTDELLTELKSTTGGTVSPVRLATFSERAATLRRLRFDQQTLSDNDRLTSFDNTQDSLFNPLARLAAPGGQAPNEKIRDLVEAMQLDDSDEVGQRIRYDRFAKSYNEFLKTHEETIEDLKAPYTDLQPLPLFQLPQ